MSLEEERGHGELNVKRDTKALKKHFQHKSQWLKVRTCCASMFPTVIRMTSLVKLVLIRHCGVNEQAFSQNSLPSCQFMINIQCFHSTIKEHHALLAKTFLKSQTLVLFKNQAKGTFYTSGYCFLYKDLKDLWGKTIHLLFSPKIKLRFYYNCKSKSFKSDLTLYNEGEFRIY